MTPSVGDRAATLRRVESPPPRAALAGLARVVRRGEALFDVGAPADCVYQVESGLLALALPLRSGRQRIVSLAGPGEFVGALSPSRFEHEERAEALSHTVSVVSLLRDEVEEPLERALFASLDARASRLRRTIEDGDRPVAVRLGLVLLDLGARYGHVGGDGATRLTLPLTHEHLAAMIGAARETTSAALATLRSEAGVEGTRGRYRFCERPLRAAIVRLDAQG